MYDRKNEGFVVEGFCFMDVDEAEQAKKEREGIKYIKSKTDKNYPETVLNIYNKMIDEELFETAVGHAYMKELQDYLVMMPAIDNNDIAAIPIKHPNVEASVKKERMKQRNQQRVMEEKLKKAKAENKGKIAKKYKTSLVFNLIFAVCIVLMFIINMTSQMPTILNYETELVDKYAAWEQELTEREQAIREKELELEIEPEAE